MGDLRQILDENVKAVRNYLDGFIEQGKPVIGSFKKYSDELDRLTWDYTRREWKGLRSLLTMLTAKTFAGDEETALILGAVMQLEQDWVLIHDDIEDKSILRRDKPTLNQMVGEDIAINVGDRLKILTDRLFYKAVRRCNPEVGDRLYEFRVQMLDQTTWGQHLEMQLRKLPLSKISLPAVYTIYEFKTGTYTCEMPTGYGLIISKLNPDEILKRRKMFRAFGIPFQIEDDYLNLVAVKASGYGKEYADDVLEGKWTVFPAIAEKRLKGRHLQRHHEIYGNRNATVEDRKEEIELFRKYGVLDEGDRIRKKRSEKAMNKAYSLIPKTESGQILLDMLQYLSDRPK